MVLGDKPKRHKRAAVDWALRLITLYEFVCKQYRDHLWVYCQRFSAHRALSLTDEEVLCIYLWGVMEKRFEINTIYADTRRHLRDWFPHLPSYGGYVQRLNRLSGVFVPLLAAMREAFPTLGIGSDTRLMDALPIHLAHAKRSTRARSSARVSR
jgi:hypothetical protein